MAQEQKKSTAIDMQSLVDSHENPFVVINHDYRIMAVNKAYAQVYGAARPWALGKTCHSVSHGNDKPCDLMGEDCPHSHVFATGKPYSCLHIHYDSNHRMHQVRVTAYPLQCPDGTLCMGESIEELSAHDDCCKADDCMVGQSEAFLACKEQLNLATRSDATVLLQGETGTGKELGAQFIHDHSARKDAPFIVIDCTVLTESLFEAEVFGHAKGAFTGSVGERAGLFEQADGGTLCLDEIGELPGSLQAKLLRVLETGQYRRVGSHKTLQSDVRIICSTNRHLWESVLAGQFREDLYYRIACLNIRIPSLRDRIDDIPLLAENLLQRTGEAMERSYQLTPEAIQRLGEYHYPGNIRELRNILNVAVTHCGNSPIDASLVEKVITQLSEARQQRNHDASHSMSVAVVPENNGVVSPAIDCDSLQAVEAQYINELLVRNGGNRKRVAEALGVSERTLYRKLKRYGLG